jgi:ubiquinone/menaquinone biosynthesis C-methylase UbiE
MQWPGIDPAEQSRRWCLPILGLPGLLDSGGPDTVDAIAEGNRRVYERGSTAAYWTHGLSPSERTIFPQYASDIEKKDVLDLGIGSGRTTQFLAHQARRYVGIDYSTRMVALCRKRFPALEVREGDARDLSRFAGQSFDFVLFSYNGIDNVDHAGRMQILREVCRVLRPGGLFVFSSHDLGTVGSSSTSVLEHSRTLTDPWRLFNPRHVIKAVSRRARRLYNYWKNAGKQVHTANYAILNDGALEFALLQYYVTEQEQRRQLAEVGLTDQVLIYQEHGDVPHALHYVTRKPVKIP